MRLCSAAAALAQSTCNLIGKPQYIWRYLVSTRGAELDFERLLATCRMVTSLQFPTTSSAITVTQAPHCVTPFVERQQDIFHDMLVLHGGLLADATFAPASSGLQALA